MAYASIHFDFEFRVVPRDLHSFPTRRSSDLLRESSRRDSRLKYWYRNTARFAGSRGRIPPPANVRRLDRKSTRLNSSHVAISYAVFCLKKKKRNINHEQYTINSHFTNPTDFR